MVGYVYKTVSKILAKKLGSVLPGLVGDVQTTFVQGRKMSELPIRSLSIFPNDIAAPDNRKAPLRSSSMVAMIQGGPSMSLFVKCKRKWLTCHVKLLAWPLTAKLKWTGADLAHSKEMKLTEGPRCVTAIMDKDRSGTFLLSGAAMSFGKMNRDLVGSSLEERSMMERWWHVRLLIGIKETRRQHGLLNLIFKRRTIE
ncbi:hypothetical protein PIB30_075621 [Stylosanthes scabra]|uniref:Uncharacterized protein n=1 Tax=Stylosanthes scabra TaxID=79078 RepID=A0ABU6UPE4_9FABA|nr:hypothetical protein [Stylosanthes scabra]